jgi:hypothetical protein
MIRCTTIHTSHWWKCTFSFIVSWLLTVVTYHWSSTSSKTSSFSSSTSLSRSIPSWCIILRRLVILCGVVVGLQCVVLWLRHVICLFHNIILLLRSVVWCWYLVKKRCVFPDHHFFLHPICIRCPLSHQLHGYTVFVIMAY